MKMTIDAFRAQLLAASGFRRADGRAGTVYEAIFPSDDTVSRYARESGRPAWQVGLPDVKGFGTVTDLSVAMANDLDLADLVAQRTRAMTAPKLKTLVAQAGDVLGAWGATLEATRELYAVRLGAGPGRAARPCSNAAPGTAARCPRAGRSNKAGRRTADVGKQGGVIMLAEVVISAGSA